MDAAVRAAVLSDAALRLPEMARIRHIALQVKKPKIAAKRRKRHKNNGTKISRKDAKRRQINRSPESLRSEMDADLRR